MSYYKNLVPGQWQIGDIVMGYGTNIKINTVNVNPDDINAKDYQLSESDEVGFGTDSFKPTTMEMTMSILHNRLLPAFASMIPNFWHNQPDIHDLKREWRFDEGRRIWGVMKPLYVCSKLDDVPKIIFGRPGSFSYNMDEEYNHGEVMNILADFRRADTYAYGIVEKAAVMTQAQPNTVIAGTGGNGPSWLRVLIQGPINHPVVTLTNLYNLDEPQTIEMDYNIAPFEVVEISGYPWNRVVRNYGNPPQALGQHLIGGSPYLDRLRFNFASTVALSVTGAATTSATRIEVRYRDAYQVI